MVKWLFTGIVLFSVTGVFSQADDTAASTVTPDSATAVTNQGAPADSSDGDTLIMLTREELAQYNGKNGKPVYVAVDGDIYDFTDVKPWKKGRHHGHKSGNDLTVSLKKKSPHGMKVLTKRKPVGKVVPSTGK